MDWSKLPGPLTQALLPFQKEGVRFAVEKDGRCLIADEMGLGKTLEAISTACMYRDEWPLLVIVPSCVKFCWIEEFEKWLPDILPQDINLIQSGADASGIADSPISIVTYGLLRIPSAKLLQETIRRRKFQVVICDESHYLRNTQTLSAKIIVPIIKMANRRILLSGTPALARPVELYPQLDAVCPGKWDTFWKFTERYCEPRYLHFRGKRQRKVDGASNLEELQQRMSSMLMIRREKSEVLTQLPPKQRQRVLFDLKDSSLKKDITKRFDLVRQNIHKGSKTFQQLAASMESDTNGPSPTFAQAQEDDGLSIFRDVSTLYRMSGEAKIGPVREYIEMLCENEDLKFLVFAYHHNMMDGVEQSLYAKKVRFVRIDGHTKSVDRQANVTQFQSDPSTRVAILSILAAGVGLTLTAAKLVVFAELYWTPGVMVQCEDRAHRIGQTSRLSVHYLVARNTMDEWVWSSVCKKTIVTSAALSGKCRQLEHDEGEQYQIDVLSKADVWKPQEMDEADMEDVGNLIKSQRQPDQPSILDFLSPRQHNNASNGKQNGGTNGNGAKKSVIGSHMSKHRHLRFASPGTKIKAVNKNLDNSLIVIDSDEEEEDFKPARKKRKKINSCPRKLEIMQEEMDEYSKGSLLKCQNVREDGGTVIDLSSQEEGGGKCVSDSEEDLFNNQSCDSDSDSLPDVYLGLSSSKTKRHSGDICTDTNTDGKDTDVDENSEKMNDNEQNGPICESLESQSPSGTKSKKERSEKETALASSGNEDEERPKIEKKGDMNISTEDSVPNGTRVDINAKEMCDRNWELSQNKSDQSDNEDLFSDNSPDSIPNISTTITTPHKNEEKQSDNIDPNQWSCSTCTFLNHQDLGKCEMCDTPSKTRTRNRNKALNKSTPSKCKYSADSVRKEKTLCCHSDEPIEDLNEGVEEGHIADSCYENGEPHGVLNKNKTENSSCNSESERQSELKGSSEENYVIENVNSDESDEEVVKEKEGKCVLEEESDHYEIENMCSDSDNDHKEGSKNSDIEKLCAKLKSDDSKACDFSYFCDNGDDIGMNFEVKNSDGQIDNGDKCNDNEDVNIHELSVEEGSNNYKREDRSVVNSEKVPAKEDELLSCDDELSYEDFDKIEDFLSMNGHIGVSKNTKHSGISVIPPTCTQPSSVISSRHTVIKSPSTSVISNNKQSSQADPAISSVSSSFLQSSSRSLSSSSSSSSLLPPPQPKLFAMPGSVSAIQSPCPQIHHRLFQFSCSLNTGRIYLHDEKGQNLKVNFQPVDIEMGNTDKLPDFLKEPHHYRLLQRFVREWMSLTATKRRVIAKQGVVFERPLQAYESVRSVHGSTQRHLVKNNLSAASEKAESIQGRIRFIQRPNPDNATASADGDGEKMVDGQGTAQVVTSDGVPLCLQCHKPYTNSLLPARVITKPENAWQLRLCSRTCMDKYWTLKHASYLRDQILEIEKGICRLCQFDAQGFYSRMKSTKDVRQRAELVNKSPYHKLGHKARERLVTQVMQGQFWHVDHIVPVWRGGGMCDLDNLRTLCTPCHMKVTREQAGQRANIKKLSSAVSSGDITAFFKKS